MRRRNKRDTRLEVELFERRDLPSSPSSSLLPAHRAGLTGLRAEMSNRQNAAGSGLTLYRITNPTPFNARLVPPFRQVLVQSRPPIPGQTYNILSVSVRNGTARTYDPSSGFYVKLTGQGPAHRIPILTGEEQWKPGEVIVFYVLTKKYYPVRSVVSGGFEFDLGGSRGVAIPGPSGIYLRATYKNPAQFSRLLNWIIPFGPGAKGHELGLPDTSIWEFVSARTDLVPL